MTSHERMLKITSGVFYCTVEPLLVATSPERQVIFVPVDNPHIGSCLNLSTTATSLKRQRPQKSVPHCQNNLSTTARKISDWWKSQDWPWNVIRMARWWLIAAILLRFFYLCCCGKHKLFTLLRANVANLLVLSREHFESKQYSNLFVYFISIYYL